MPEATFNEGSSPNEIETPHIYSRTSDLVNIIDRSNFNRLNPETKKKQVEVISKLPENFLDIIENHLEEGRVTAERHKEGFNQFTYCIGEIFEQLVEIEDENDNLFPGAEKYQQTDTDKKAAKLLLDLMQNPIKYGLMQRSVTNPDWVKLSLENGTFVIKDATEAKTHLDRRTYRQLGRDGFVKAFQDIIDEINSIDKPERFGLEEFASYGINIGVALDYQQKLVVPRDLKIDRDNILKGTKKSHKKNQFRDYELDDFVSMLNDSDEVVVGHSSFSRTELQEITRWALKEIATRQASRQTQETTITNNQN